MKKRIRLTEKQVKFIVENKSKKLLTEEKGYSIEDVVGKHGKYTLTDINKLKGYLRVPPSQSGLIMDVYVDCSSSYRYDGHPLLLFASNGNGNEINGYIPFVVCNHPYIMDDNDNIDYVFDYEDLFRVQDFIQINLTYLIALSDKKIKSNVFFNVIKSVDNFDYGEICEEMRPC